MEIRVDPKKVAIAFLWMAATLAVINSILLFFYFYLDDDELYGLIDFFDFDIEGNIPTLYSAVSVLFCSALLALITHVNWHKPDGKRYYWLGQPSLRRYGRLSAPRSCAVTACCRAWGLRQRWRSSPC